MTIIGAGSNKTFIDADNIDRIFDIFSVSSNVTISGLSIYNGNLSINTDQPDGGGGIRNNATLMIQNTSIYENSISGENGAGGGVLNQATCTIRDTTISGNSAMTGGGVYNGQDTNLSLWASTIYDNMAQTGAGLANSGSAELTNATLNSNNAHLGTSPRGGGIYNNANLELRQSTVADNATTGEGGGLSNNGIATLVNTIIANNNTDNCSTQEGIFSLGYNLESTHSCGLDQETDIVQVDPGLYPLWFNGGPTRTQAIRPDSPAIDAGQNLLAEGIHTDQRGEKRPSGIGFDIGAYEWQKISMVPLIAPLLLSGNH